MKNIIDIKQPTKSRNADYKLYKAFDDFEPITDSDDLLGTSGNIKNLFEQYSLESDYITSYGAKNQKPFYDLVSAPMLLARLVSFGCIPLVNGMDGHKVTWQIGLRHKETGLVVTFYDWKGASSYGSNREVLNCKKTQKDFLKLLKALINPRFPHPYDGCVVGEIA